MNETPKQTTGLRYLTQTEQRIMDGALQRSVTVVDDCDHCRGLGFFSLPPRKCSECKGRGWLMPRECQEQRA